MSDGDRAAVDIEAVVGNAELVAAIENLHRERLVQLPQSDVVHRDPRALQKLGHRDRGSDAHLVGLASGHREAAENAQRLQALAGRRICAHHHARGCSVRELAGVARRDHAPRERRLDPGKPFVGRVAADALVRRDDGLAACSSPDVLVHVPIVTVIGTISASNLPAAAAAAARCWLCTPYSILPLAGDAVALRDILGGLQHRPVDLGLVLGEPALVNHVLVRFVLHAGDRLDPTGYEVPRLRRR